MNSEPLRPLRFLSQTFIISGDNVEAAESAYSCASNLIASSIFRAGAFLLKGRLVRAFATVAIGWGLLPGNLWSQTVPAESPSQTPTPPTPGTESTCFGATVSKIDFPGISLPDQKTWRGMIAANEGAPLDRARLQESLRTLFVTGRFADLRAECDRSADGKVTLAFVGSANFFVGRVSVEGAPGRPTESQIVNASKRQLGELFASEKIDVAVKNIRRLMEENQFYRSSITHSEQENPTTQQIEIAFHIHSGDPAHVGNVTLQGDSSYSLGQIEDIAHLHSGNIISAQKAADALQRIRKRYQNRNRWLAQVSIAEKKYITTNNTVDYALLIQEGPLVEITTEGFRLGRKTLRKNVPVYEENALDDDLLNEGRRNLLNYMESSGYLDCNVDLKKESDEQKKHLRVVYQIDAGERHRVVKVDITGNKYLQDQNLRPLMH